jgi:hypothetical protein
MLLGYSLAVLVALQLTLAVGQQTVTAEVISKGYSSRYFPVVGSYVEYEVRLTNTGDVAVENRLLVVSLVSDGNRTHSYATYSIELLQPGGSRTLYLGPFKMEEEGGHRLLVSIEGAALDYHPDSFTVYRQEAIHGVLVAVPLIVAGAAIVSFSIYRKGRSRTV